MRVEWEVINSITVEDERGVVGSTRMTLCRNFQPPSFSETYSYVLQDIQRPEVHFSVRSAAQLDTASREPI